MPSLLSSHLEQISLCSSSIASLPFQGPKIFSNALLANHDITSLIRDTEAHERALFHLAAPALPPNSTTNHSESQGARVSQVQVLQRRATTYGSYGARQPKNKAVAAVLGGDLYAQTRRQERQKGEIDVEALLHGAEKLAAVYPIPSAAGRIAELRSRQQQLEANVRYYEERVARQARELQRMKGGWGEEDDAIEEEMEEVGGHDAAQQMTKEDLEREEEECRELERKKRGLEERVTGMERDLGGLMR